GGCGRGRSSCCRWRRCSRGRRCCCRCSCRRRRGSCRSSSGRRWGRRACWNQRPPTGRRTTYAVAEVLSKAVVVSLYSRRGAGVAIACRAIDHVKPSLPLVQSYLEVGTAGPREVLRPPLDVKDAVRRTATYRCEYAKPAID